MSIIRTIMYRAVCDACGEGDDGEYWAWSDEGQARDQWDSYDHHELGDGRLFHRDCLPPEFCPLGDYPDLAHEPDEDNPGMCVECEKPIPQPERRRRVSRADSHPCGTRAVRAGQHG